MQYIKVIQEQPVEGDSFMNVFSSSLKKYDDYRELPIIKAIEEITKGGFYEEKENFKKSFAEIIQENSKQN